MNSFRQKDTFATEILVRMYQRFGRDKNWLLSEL